MVFIDTTNI